MHVHAANGDSPKNDVNNVFISIDSADAKVVSASVFDSDVIIRIRGNISIRFEEVRACVDDTNGDRLGAGSEIQATS